MGTYQTPKYDPQRLEILVELRKAADLSQSQVAEFFDLADYGSVAAWEAGISKPHATRRPQVIIYLVDQLGLRRDYHKFCRVWNDLMVEEWEWESLSQDELWHLFPGHTSPLLHLLSQHSPRAKSYPDHETELAHLDRLLADLRAIIYRLLDT